jgi:hypothetical protein
MIDYFKIHQITHHCFYLMYPWVAKLHDIITLVTYHVVVLTESKSPFVAGYVFAKLVFDNQSTFQKQV